MVQRGDEVVQLCACLIVGFQGGRVQHVHLQWRMPQNHLHRLAQALPQHRAAQDVVAVDHGLQCS